MLWVVLWCGVVWCDAFAALGARRWFAGLCYRSDSTSPVACRRPRPWPSSLLAATSDLISIGSDINRRSFSTMDVSEHQSEQKQSHEQKRHRSSSGEPAHCPRRQPG